MKIPFSNGTEADWWIEHNCMQCWRGRNFINMEKVENPYCKPCQSIMDGYIIGVVSEKAYEYTRNSTCPNKQEQKPISTRKTDKYKNEPTLF